MPITLKGKILEIVNTLKESEKYKLAECIENNWDKKALAYSKELNFWRPKNPIEKELLSAFAKELERVEKSDLHQKEILASLRKRRVLQTAPHIGATESPRMLCINWLGSLAVEDNGKDFYVVGMFSGVPFSNKSRPGRINKKSESINLFPSSLQDGLVYRSTIQPKLLEVVEKLPMDISRYLPKAVIGESYTKWALNTCEHIEKKILGKKNLVYIDINEVVANYLTKVLHDRFHLVHKLFFDKKTRTEFAKAFPDEVIFYTPVMDGKYEKMENMYLDGDKLIGKNKEIDLNNAGLLVKELEEGRLCPGLVLSFLILAFLNEFKCFGSFAQVEYLPVYQAKLSKLSFMKDLNIDNIPTANLTTGVFPEKSNLYPIDILESQEKFKPAKDILFGELILPMKGVLLESYFTGDSRKTNGTK